MWPRLAGLSVLLCAAPASGQVPYRFHDWDQIEYRAKLVRLCETHVKNHRARGTLTAFDVVNWRTLETGRTVWNQSDVCGDGAWITEANHRTKEGNVVSVIRHLTPDALRGMRSDTGGPPYIVFSWTTEWEARDDVYAKSFALFMGTSQIYHPEVNEKIRSHERTEFNGRPALKVRTTRPAGTPVVVYLDADTYQLLVARIDKPADGVDGNGPVLRAVTYRDAGGKRYPAKSELSRVHEDGYVLKVQETEISEYEPHAPTPKELDLQDRAGVTVTPHGPRPAVFPRWDKVENSRIVDEPLPDRTARYVIVVVALIVLVAILFSVRRRSGVS